MDRDIWLVIQRYAPHLQQGQQKTFNQLYDPKQVKVVDIGYNCTAGEFNRVPDPAVVHYQGRAWEGDNKYSGLLRQHLKAAGELCES